MLCLQRLFKAKPVPAHVHEHRMEGMLAAQEAARLSAKVKLEMAKERVQKTREEERMQRYVETLMMCASGMPCTRMCLYQKHSHIA